MRTWKSSLSLPVNLLTSLVFAWTALAPSARAEPVYLVADIGTDKLQAPSRPDGFIATEKAIFFTAVDDQHGRELWMSDGSPEGTALVLDLRPGPASSSPFHLTAGADGVIYFVAVEDVAGWGLWKSDGTREGTVRIRHIPSVSLSALPVTWIRFYKGQILASVRDDANETELWAGDETSFGKLDLCPEACSSYPGPPRVFGDRLVFAARDAEAGAELWTSDGTPQGTERMTDICPGACDGVQYFSEFDDFEVLRGELFFPGDDGVNGSELWKSDGTPQGTSMVEDLRAGNGSAPRGFTRFGNRIYFKSAGLLGEHRVWKSDGTAAGTVPATELIPYGVDEPPGFLFVTLRGLFFTIELRDRSELWIYDGSTRRLRSDFKAIHTFERLGDRALLSVRNAAEESALWLSDGTASGTRELKAPLFAFFSQPQPAINFTDHLFFNGDDGETGFELWRTDGTAQGTELFKDLRPERDLETPEDLVIFDQQLYFKVDRGPGADPRLWRSDGTESGTELVDPNLAPQELKTVADRLFFVEESEHTLWAFDKEEGGRLLSSERFPDALTAAGGLLFYRIYRFGQPLWVSDGTAEGTFEVLDINPDWGSGCIILCPGPEPAFPALLTAVGDAVYFLAVEEENYQLWRSDGTESGTGEVRDLGLAFDDHPYLEAELIALDEATLVMALGEPGGPRLWRSDGTPEGTEAFFVAPEGSAVSRFTAVSGRAFFVLRDSAGAERLWITDGTGGGTREVSSLATEARIGEMKGVGGKLFLSVFEPTTGAELWVSDGTGAHLVEDLLPGPRGSSPSSFGEAYGFLVFAAEDGLSGQEVFMSDGTAAGTFQVDDVLSGRGASGPRSFLTSGSRVFFSADDGASGRELFAFDLAEVPELHPTAAFEGAVLVGTAPHTVEFVDRSTGLFTSSQWDFGDGATAASRDAVHTYAEPGVYTVSLKVDGPAGEDAATEEAYVLVWPDLLGSKRP